MLTQITNAWAKSHKADTQIMRRKTISMINVHSK